MSGNVGGQDGNQVNIRLYNGKTINLKKLDKLVGQSTAGSVFAKFDSAENGGNANNVFDEAEVTQIKNQLRQYQANDNSVSQEELNQMFGYGQLDENGKKKNFNVNNLNSFLDSMPEDTSQAQQSVKDTPPTQQQTFTNYTVQPGDTPKKLAEKFGLQGDDAEAFIKHLKGQTNKKGWFTVGQKITLLGDHAEAMKNMTDYSEDMGTLQTRWANTESGQKALAAAEARKQAQAKVEAKKPEVKSTPKPTPTQDKTPNAQRITISSTRSVAKQSVSALKGELQATWTSNSKARKLLGEKMINRQAAYVLEQYPDLVSDIDNVLGMNKADIKKYVVTPLNGRLRELGMNKHCIPEASIDKMKIADIKAWCNKTAAMIRNTDAENGYVFKPAAGNEGKVHKPRLASQSNSYAAPKAKAKPKAATASKPANAPTAPKLTPAQEKQIQELRARQLLPYEAAYPEGMREKIIDLRLQGIKCNVTETRYGFTVELDESKKDPLNINSFAMKDKQTNPFNFYKPNTNWLPDFMKTSKTLVFDKEGNLVQEKQGYYDRTVTTHYQNGKEIGTDTQLNTSVNYGQVDVQRAVSADDKVPVKINIRRPDDLNEAGTTFANSLEQNKAALMKRLNITNAQYNNLADIAMGIAEQETHFGDYLYKDTNGDTHMQGRLLKKNAWSAVGGNINSKGITQIRWNLHFGGDKEPNKTLRAQANSFGIYGEDDYKDNPEKAAILTMIILNNKRITAEGEVWQERLKTNNAKISDPKLQMTTNDIIALSWNGMGAITARFKDPNDTVTIQDKNSGKKDAKGDIIKDGTSYARNVRAYMKHFYGVSENQTSRTRANALNTQSQGNNGKLGSVIFMPGAYTTNVGNTQADIDTLSAALNKNPKIPQPLKDRLLMAAKNNDIAFGNGLTADEAASITANDAKLMLEKLDGLKSKVANLVDPAKIREAARATDDSFRSSYLQSRQVVVNDRDVSSGSILPALNSGDVVDERLVAKGQRKLPVNTGNVHNFRAGAGRSRVTTDGGQYYGFGVEADKGVNPYDAKGNIIPRQQRILAECASDVAAIMDCGGRCATGVKTSLQAAGVVGDRSQIGFANKDGSWNKCENAKDLATYFSKHPEKFEEIKYLSLGNGTSREINASDLKNLPAGYIVVFIPGAGYENQAGHALITNGNGQGYADEVDNIRWDNFVSRGAGNGKGEHGTFKIFKLKA